ncbi:MAG: DUF3108 domain-containing protein [Pseudomonadota bacterium]|nr:DUF3108 domain-containing protein [Pseudomonadota bacterium]
MTPRPLFSRKTGLLAAMFALAGAPALAVEPFTADYQANYMGMQANGTMTLAPAGAGRWKYSLDIRGMGATMGQSTVFEARDGRWRPLASSDSQQGTAGLASMLVKKKRIDATYDWDRGEARWTGDVKADRAGPVKLRDGDLDAMLLNLALVRDVNAGNPMNYRLVEDGRARQQAYRIAGKESISVGGQQRQATKVVRDDGDRQILAWVVDGLPVPARILQRRDGKDHIDLRLKAVR